jgi:hypothetical protein
MRIALGALGVTDRNHISSRNNPPSGAAQHETFHCRARLIAKQFTFVRSNKSQQNGSKRSVLLVV